MAALESVASVHGRIRRGDLLSAKDSRARTVACVAWSAPHLDIAHVATVDVAIDGILVARGDPIDASTAERLGDDAIRWTAPPIFLDRSCDAPD